MLLRMYAIFDKKARNFRQPFFAANDDVARRILQGIMNEPNEISNHPQDFYCERLGIFNDVTGAMVSEGDLEEDEQPFLFEFREIKPMVSVHEIQPLIQQIIDEKMRNV